MKCVFLIFIFIMSACNQSNRQDTKDTVLNNGPARNRIPEIRDTLNKESVASYIIPMGDPRLDRKFGVEVFETSQTFKYILKMQYDGMIQTDTLRVPNFGTWPVIKIKPGKEKLSCIIGFLDEKNNLREYKLLSAQKNRLNLSVLKSYEIVNY